MIQHWLSIRKHLNLPSPGICLPVFGHFHLLLNGSAKEDPVGFLSRLWKTHQKGGVLWFRRFAADILLVGDLKVAKQLFNHPAMQGRSTCNSALKKWLLENRGTVGKQVHGVLFSDGPIWAEQRRFTLRTLRDFGFGKAKMEELINEEVEAFTEALKSYRGEPVDIAGKFNLPILNSLWRITVGQRFDYDDPKLRRILANLTEFFQRIGNPKQLIELSFPRMSKLLEWIAPNVLERGKTIAINREIMALMCSTVRDHEKTIDVNEPRDFTDSALLEILRTTDPSSSFYADSGRINLANTLVDLFIAGNFSCHLSLDCQAFLGSETTSTTLTWGLLYMARYSEVQERMQEEMDRVIGRARRPQLSDRNELPFTCAVLLEVQRYANILPVGVPHVSDVDFTLGDLTIPTGTRVGLLMSELLKGDHWGDGENFRPDRFLDEEGKSKTDEWLVPFSIGRNDDTLKHSNLCIKRSKAVSRGESCQGRAVSFLHQDSPAVCGEARGGGAASFGGESSPSTPIMIGISFVAGLLQRGHSSTKTFQTQTDKQGMISPRCRRC